MALFRGKDARGSFYSWGAGGAKHRYIVGDRASRERAKARATAAVKTGGRTPRKPRKKAISSTVYARKKLADKSTVAKAAAYRRAAVYLK